MTDTGKKTHRAFIAVALPENVTAALGRLQGQLKEFGIKMKYTDPQNIHLTLKFLGDIRAEDVETVSEQLDRVAAGFSPLGLFAKGMGVFPGIRRARVMWTGVAGQTEILGRLNQEVEEAMADLGFEQEKKRFSGHLTLGRFKGGSDPGMVADAIGKFGEFASDSFTADSLHLFESTLTPDGPIYEILSSHSFKG
ncbi:MAG: RNA 2',3'-cyclic phosphodiesterase [Desulfobacteraceae bacterium]|nr:RNA 2',3'-cyclic phosphodiesterase [Desulfobacteraceae bacterium]